MRRTVRHTADGQPRAVDNSGHVPTHAARTQGVVAVLCRSCAIRGAGEAVWAAMRRGLVHVLAWSLATGAAVTLSWWGVHTVMAGTAYDPPRALPIAAAEANSPEPLVSATARARPSQAPERTSTPSPTVTRRTASASPAPTGSASGSPTPKPSATGSGQVKSWDTAGGRVVFDLDTADATLVSASPKSGWSMQVWKTETWIRVEFTSGTDKVSVICAWHDGPPHVEVGNY